MILSGGEMATDSDRHASGTGDEPIIVGRIAGPYGVKGIGEATLNPVAAAIANAVADAT